MVDIFEHIQTIFMGFRNQRSMGPRLDLAKKGKKPWDIGGIWSNYSGWWFQAFFIFHTIWDNPSHWLIFFKMVKTTNQYFTYNMPLAAKASNHGGCSPRRQNWSFFQEDVLKLKTNCSPWKCTEQPDFFNNINIFIKPTGWCFPASCFITPLSSSW